MAFLLVIVYIAFISLGVPDSLIGAAWPAIYPDMQMPVEAISGITLLISGYIAGQAAPMSESGTPRLIKAMYTITKRKAI